MKTAIPIILLCGALAAAPSPSLAEGQAGETVDAIRVSPGKAAARCINPFRSGSFEVDVNVPGVSFTVLKTASSLLCLAVLLGGASSSSYGDSEGGGSEGSPIMEDESTQRLFFASLGVWAASTAADMLWSYFYVKSRVAPAARAAAWDARFFAAPRLAWDEGAREDGNTRSSVQWRAGMLVRF